MSSWERQRLHEHRQPLYDDESVIAPPTKSIYRDHCNTCGAERGDQHLEHCHLTGEVVAWSGVR